MRRGEVRHEGICDELGVVCFLVCFASLYMADALVSPVGDHGLTTAQPQANIALLEADASTSSRSTSHVQGRAFLISVDLWGGPTLY